MDHLVLVQVGYPLLKFSKVDVDIVKNGAKKVSASHQLNSMRNGIIRNSLFDHIFSGSSSAKLGSSSQSSSSGCPSVVLFPLHLRYLFGDAEMVWRSCQVNGASSWYFAKIVSGRKDPTISHPQTPTRHYLETHLYFQKPLGVFLKNGHFVSDSFLLWQCCDSAVTSESIVSVLSRNPLFFQHMID